MFGRSVLTRPVFGFGMAGGWLSGGDRLSKWREDVIQDLVDDGRAAHNEHMITFCDDVRGIGTAKGEDFVAGAVEVKKGVWKGVVAPFEDGVETPADVTIVAFADDLAHDLPVLDAGHGEVVLGDRGYF